MALPFIAQLRQECCKTYYCLWSSHDWCTALPGQFCKSALPSCDNFAYERKRIKPALYCCLKFYENPHEICNFICNLQHGLTPCRKSHSQMIIQLMWNTLNSTKLLRIHVQAEWLKSISADFIWIITKGLTIKHTNQFIQQTNNLAYLS